MLAIVQVFGSSVFMIAGVMVPPLTDPEGGFRWGIGELSMSTMRTIIGRLSWVRVGVIRG